jgi:energy-coupling factor transporter ATP-binding protein EcfA2
VTLAWSASPNATPAACPAGNCKRLAVAAALAREPALLIADEVTSMVDQQGRGRATAIVLKAGQDGATDTAVMRSC